MAMARRLPMFQTLLAQHALRSAIPKPKPHNRFLHCPSPPAAVSDSGDLLRRSSGSAAAALAAAKRWLMARAAGSLELFSLQRTTSSSSSTTSSLRNGPWARFMPSADGTMMMLMAANVAVYMLWQKADASFMREHFTISLDNVSSGRLHTLLTHAFSHTEQHALLGNMMCLLFFGSSISSTFGPTFLLSLYVAGALVGSTFFLVEEAFKSPRKQVYVEGDISKTLGLGARSAVNAIVLLHIFLNPKGKIYLYFIFLVPAALVGVVWIGLDLLRATKGERMASGSSHLGGTLVAALAWARIRKGWI